jgi:O-succinylhomoserine sulfhydrylase
MKKETFLIRNQIERTEFREHSAPIYFNSSYVFDDAEHMRALFADEQDGYIYSRYSNPNVDEFCSKMAFLENTESAWATSSGMAAVYTTFAALLKAGDEIVSCSSIFGSTHRLFTEILPKFNIHTRYGAYNDVEAWEQLITTNTRMVYIESPTNPALDLVDIQQVSALCKKHNLLLVVDNCFATPLVQQPANQGADIIIHSATKYIDGQGRAMGGVICATAAIIKQIEAFARHTGPALSPFNAWVLSKSLETLAVRIERHVSNALELAKRLSEHPQVKIVKYPFLPTHPQYELAQKQMLSGGGLIAFELQKGLEQGKNFLNKLQMISLTANLGDVRTIATHPASTTHSKLTESERLNVGITPGLVRISVGLEHIEDIWADVAQALGE